VNHSTPFGLFCYKYNSSLYIESLAGYLGAIVGGIGLGYVAKHASINLAWTISGVVLITSLVLYLQVDARQRRANVPKTISLEAR
jgi:hypothetical protein